jgi:hypothetical protein
MKRLSAAMALALLTSLALGSSAANATHSEGGGPHQDLVAGTGRFEVFPGEAVKIHVNAKSGPSGEDARGRFSVNHEGFYAVRGEVTCLSVVGNRATVGGEITQAQGELEGFEGFGILIIVEDNGEGDEPNDGVISSVVATPPEQCSVPFEVRPIEQGDYIVHDATL